MQETRKIGFSEILGEVRIFGEYLRFRGDTVFDRARVIRDDWRPILLIPGFMAGDASLSPLGARLRSQGHRVFYAGIWMNADCPAKTLGRLRDRVHQISLQTGRKVVIIGHSLGGLYARELARMESDLVEQVFLLGSPVRHTPENTTPYLRPLVAAIRLIHRECMEGLSQSCKTCGLGLSDTPPDVPETCVYTKSDGVVEWHSCIEDGPKVECVEVDSSHCGIPLNPKTWQAISSRLVGIAPEAHPLPWKSVERSRAVAPRTPHRTRASYPGLTSGKGNAA